MLALSLVAVPKKAVPTKAVAKAAKNLLQNGGAEMGNDNKRIPHWTAIPPVEDASGYADTWGHVSGEWEWKCDEKCGLPKNGGTWYFRLPVASDVQKIALQQAVPIAFKPGDEAKLSAMVTGFQCDQEASRAKLRLELLDASDEVLAEKTIEKPNKEMHRVVGTDDSRLWQFEPIGAALPVPAGTKKARVTMEANDGDCNGAVAFFDNVALVVGPREP
jgi:hypothetical protein